VRLRATPAELALLLTMSSFGLAASALVLYEFYTLHRLPPLCQYHPNTGGIQLNCYAVLTSPYSRVGPFSLDALAAAWFITNICLSPCLPGAPDGCQAGAEGPLRVEVRGHRRGSLLGLR